MTQKNIPATVRFSPQQIVCLENRSVEQGIPGPNINWKILDFWTGNPWFEPFSDIS